MATTLVINPGSSSRKYALFDGGKIVRELSFEGTGTGFEVCIQSLGGTQTCESISQLQYENACKRVTEVVREYTKETNSKLTRIAVRIVAPGTLFQQHRNVDAAFIRELRECELLAPLHIPAMLREIEMCTAEFPSVRVIGISDSAFHVSLPLRARQFSLNAKDARDLDLYRFGYHGLSVGSIVHRIHAVVGKDPSRVVVCHVGNGVSITALKDGVSVETSMGYAPLSGVPMGSRASDLDPGALLSLMRQKNFRLSEVAVYLHKNGGLAGLAGEGDIRHLLERRAIQDKSAIEALELFSYRIRKEIAAATAALEGIDALVFTGTAALRSAELRSMIVSGLSYLGITVDDDRNNLLVGKEGVISPAASVVKVVVMRTDEMREMAAQAELFESQK